MAEYRERRYDVLELDAKPYDATEPVICLDEKRKRLVAQTRRPLAGGPGHSAKEDYEYQRAGTRNLCVAVEPQAGHREVAVPHRRRLKLGFWTANAPAGASAPSRACSPKCGPGTSAATKRAAAVSGSSRAKPPTRSYRGTM